MTSQTDVLIIVPPLVDYDSEVDRKAGKPDFENRRLISPIDPLTVAAVLRHRGYNVELFDMGIFTETRLRKVKVREVIDSHKPRYLAIVQSILTFATAQDWDGKEIFDWAKITSPESVTILTGSHATNYPGRAVEEELCLYSIKGEVEFSLPDLIDALEDNADLKSIPGLSYKTGEGLINKDSYPKVDIETLPLPAYEILDSAHVEGYSQTVERGKIRYPEKSRNYRDLMTSKSCVLRCSFCSVAHFRGNMNKYRRKTTDMVMAEIDQALEQGIQEIHFFDDLFAATKEEIITICNELSRRNYKFDWFVAQGLNLWFLDFETLHAMTSTGMYRLIAPFESGNDRVLREVVGKIHSTTQQHHDVAVWAKKLDLELIGMFVVGMPGETRGEISESVKFAETHPEIDYSVFSIATPMIGTRMTKKLIRQGAVKDVEIVNKVIKRTVALFNTEEFSEVEMGIIRAFDWDRINFSKESKRSKYCRMVGISEEELEEMRHHSISTFEQYFGNYQGPRSFQDMVNQSKHKFEVQPLLPS